MVARRRRWRGGGARAGARIAVLAALAAWFFGVSLLDADEGRAQVLGGCGGLLQPRCPAPPPPPECRDGGDNDGDAVTDLSDPGCASPDDDDEGDDVAPDINGNPEPGPDVDPRRARKVFGFNTSLSQWRSGVTVDQEAALIRMAGGNAQRLGIPWSSVEPNRGDFRWSQLDWQHRMYAELRAHGMTPIFNLLDAPAWASDYARCFLLDLACRTAEERRLPPRDIKAYASFVAQIAARYPEAVIETWNEPNIRSFWDAGSWPDPGRMATMQCAAYDAVKAQSPRQRVAGPGLAYIGPAHFEGGQEPYLRFTRALYQGMGDRICWDMLSVHIYPSSDLYEDGEGAADAFRVVRNLRREFGDTTPIWVTETGASTSGGQGGDHGHTQRTAEEQAMMLRATVNELLTTSDVGGVVIHTLRDRSSYEGGSADPGHVQYGFGLLEDGSGPYPPPKPAWCHFVGVVDARYPGC